MLQKNCQKQELQLSELKCNNDAFSLENKNLNQILKDQKRQFESLFNELNAKVILVGETLKRKPLIIFI